MICKSDKGFTFIETIASISIIMILTAAVGFSSVKYIENARVVSCRNQIEALRLALQSYYLDCGQYPSEAQACRRFGKNRIFLRFPFTGTVRMWIVRSPKTRGRTVIYIKVREKKTCHLRSCPMELTTGPEETAQMRISVRGTDSGSALLSSLIFILVVSLLFVSLVPRISSMNRLADETKNRVYAEIEQANREIMKNHDLH